MNEFGRYIPETKYVRQASPVTRRRSLSPMRYTVNPHGRIVNEFGRNYHNYKRPKKVRGMKIFNEKTRTYKRPIHVFNETTRTYVPMSPES